MPLLAALGAVSAFGVSGCADPSASDPDGVAQHGPVGSLGLSLELAPGAVVHTVDYTITGPNGFSINNSLPVDDATGTVSAFIAAIPVGQGYQLKLTARVEGDAGLACAGQATFDVSADLTTVVDVALLCDTVDTSGGVSINGSFNVCPSVTATTVTPNSQTVGQPIALTLAARDVDHGPSAIAYGWSSSSGTFSNANAANTSFTCATPGAVTLNYEINDGSCHKEGMLSVTCVADTGGGLDAGSALAHIVINEVESNGGTPDDWVELYNAETHSVDISGWGLRDNDSTHAVFKIPAGTIIAAGGYYVLDTKSTSVPSGFNFGLGAPDSAILYAPDGTTVVDEYDWTTHATSTYGRCPNGSGSFAQTTTSKGAANICGISTGDAGTPTDAGVPSDAGTTQTKVVINEVESNGGTPDDWVELYNQSTQPIDISGWGLRDNDSTHAVFKIPAGTTIAAGGYYVLDTKSTSVPSGFNFGLGAPDSAILYAPDGTTILDEYDWTAHATSTYGRCPNGFGPFAQTTTSKGAANICPSADGGTPGTDAGVDAGVDASTDLPWPGPSTVTEVDAVNAFASNLSGLSYHAGATLADSVLYGVQNGPSMLYRLHDVGGTYVSTTDSGWTSGKQIFYPTGAGAPDSEGVVYVTGETAGSAYLYVSTERDNNDNGVSRLSVLQYDANATSTTLTALREWNLTADLPPTGANLGLEAITFISDAELAAQSFREGNGQPYDVNRYAQHGGGVFLVGVEGTGMIHVYAFNHADGTFARLSSFSSGMPAVMDLAYDPDTRYLWAYGDDSQGNRAFLFQIDQNPASATYGQFVQHEVFAKPTGMPNYNNEGISFAPNSECVDNLRAFFWADDGADNGHSLRKGGIPCGKTY